MPHKSSPRSVATDTGAEVDAGQADHHDGTGQHRHAARSAYGARPVKRVRATRAEMEARRQRLVELTLEHGPCSVRHLFYRAVVDGMPGIGKNQAGYVKVQRELLRLRRDGTVPYHLIVDNSRTVFDVSTFDSPDGFLTDMAGLYRRDLWRRTAYRVEVWAESDSIASTLLDVTERWRVPLFPIRGQSSETFAYNAARSWDPDRLPVVLYVGDHDPAGLEIEDALAEKLAGFAADAGVPAPSFRRLGVTWQQVVDLDLPGTTPKKDYGFPLAVEAEALPPRLLRDLVDEAIADYVDPREVAVLEAVEAEERAGLYALAGTVGGGS
jgi:hypothetical protein